MSHSSLTEYPYHPGRALQIFFKPEHNLHSGHDPFLLRDLEVNSELSPTWTDGFTPLTVSILKSFTPFTSAVVLLVKVLQGPKDLQIPQSFILKLNDRRFGYRDQDRPQLTWHPVLEGRLRAEIAGILGTERADPIPQMYYRAPARRPGDTRRLPAWDGWELEIHVWTQKSGAYLNEALAYRHLRALQGTCIPRLHGSVRLPISPGTPFLHPIVDFVPGLAIEHIPGPNMGALKVGTDITKAVANRISRRLIDNVALVRDAHCHHRDLRLPNVILRNLPHDPDPVLIDFGLSSVMPPDCPKDEWGFGFDETVEIRKVLTNAENGGWHVASPYKQYIYDRYAAIFGPQHVNAEIEGLPNEVREEQFERVPGTGGPDARDRVVQWRVRSGVRTQDDFLERQPIPESERVDGEDKRT
ncbi:hypothetical protein FB451DRAFT_1395504 [Mycena latifolia]|nr:hypothetical protein FB451DRAFT_1395504 [Mycena latifolia]